MLHLQLVKGLYLVLQLALLLIQFKHLQIQFHLLPLHLELPRFVALDLLEECLAILLIDSGSLQGPIMVLNGNSRHIWSLPLGRQLLL